MKWGPSAHTCLELLQELQDAYEAHVKQAARDFVSDPAQVIVGWNANPTNVSHILFSIQLRIQPGEATKRSIPTPEIATDHITEIISLAVVEAEGQVQASFYLTISKHPDFRSTAGHLFEAQVLGWFYSKLTVEPLHCFPAKNDSHHTIVQIPACGINQVKYLGSLNGLQTTIVDTLLGITTSQQNP